jgi:hypothetical protein
MPAVLEAMGRLARPTMLILGARRATGRAAHRLAGYMPKLRLALYRAAQQDRYRIPKSIRDHT